MLQSFTTLEAVASRVRLVNDTAEPRTVRRHEHHCQARRTTVVVPASLVGPHPSPPHSGGSNSPQAGFFSDAVVVDSDNILPDTFRNEFHEVLQTHDEVFNPAIVGYNGMAGPVQASVNMGPVQPPQRKGRVPQYSRDKLVELQQKFDELEQCQVFRRPEDIRVTVEYLNPSFLVKKPSGGFRLVSAFTDVGRYSKPQPSLMPDVDSTLRTIAPWKYIPHPCLLPDTSIKGLHETLRCGHSVSRHQSIYQFSHGNARFRDCTGGINVSCPW